MPKLDPFVRLVYNYYGATTAYGFVRGCVHTFGDARIDASTYPESARRMLVSEKTEVIALSTITGCMFFPIMAFNDMSRLEIRLKGLDPKQYGYSAPKSVLGYVLG